MREGTVMDYHNWLVLKLGSKSFADETNNYAVRTEVLDRIAVDVKVAREMGWGVIIVSSGAAFCGRRLMRLAGIELDDNQQYSVVGQTTMMSYWEEAFSRVGLVAGQVVLTNKMLENEPRRSSIVSLAKRNYSQGIISIINENDAVVNDECRKINDEGDNDKIGYNVARAAGAELLVMLTTVDGVYKTKKQAAGQKPIPWISAADEKTESWLRAWKGDSNGGMSSKVKYGRRFANLEALIRDERKIDRITHICCYSADMPVTRAIRNVHMGTIISKKEILN